MILDIYKDALEYSAKDWKKLIKLGIIFLFSFLLVPIFLVYGYNYRTIKTAINGIIGGNDSLPGFDNLIGMWVDGVKVAVITVIYALIPIIIFIIFSLIASHTAGQVMVIAAILTFIIGIITFLMSMIGICNMAQHEGAFKKAFEFREILNIIGNIGWFETIITYVGIAIISTVISFVVTFIITTVFSILGFSGIALGFSGDNIFLLGTVINLIITLFIIGPYLTIFNSRVTGLLYNLQ